VSDSGFFNTVISLVSLLLLLGFKQEKSVLFEGRNNIGLFLHSLVIKPNRW